MYVQPNFLKLVGNETIGHSNKTIGHVNKAIQYVYLKIKNKTTICGDKYKKTSSAYDIKGKQKVSSIKNKKGM